MGEEPMRLRPEDERLLDELLEAGFDPAALEQMEPAARERGERLVHLMNLLRDYPVEDGDDTLVHATLARIDRHERERAERMSFRAAEEADARRRRRLRLPDFVSVAAVLLIAVGLLWPAIESFRQPTVDSPASVTDRSPGSGEPSPGRAVPPPPSTWSAGSPMSHADLGFGRFSGLFGREVDEEPLTVEPLDRSFRVFEVTGLRPFRSDRNLLLRMDLEHVANVRDLLDLSLSLRPSGLDRYVVLTDGRGTLFLVDRDEFESYRRLWMRYGVDATPPLDPRRVDRDPAAE